MVPSAVHNVFENGLLMTVFWLDQVSFVESYYFPVLVGLSPEIVSDLNQRAVVMSATQALVIGRAPVSLELSMHSSPVLSSKFLLHPSFGL